MKNSNEINKLLEKYSIKFNEYEDLIQTHNSQIFPIEKIDIKMLKLALHRNIILGVYTCWENFCKDVIYDICINKYKKSFVGDSSMKNYLEVIFEKSYLKNKLFNSIQGNSILMEKDLLCSSNNIGYNEMKRLFSLININIVKEFEKQAKNDESFKLIIEELQSLVKVSSGCVELVKGCSSNEIFKAFKYIETVVQLRNEISHNYEISEVCSTESLIVIIKFFRWIFNAIYKVVISTIILKEKENKRSKMIAKLKIVNIYLEGGKTEEKPAIIELIFKNKECNIKNIKDKLILVYDSSNDLFREVEVISCKNSSGNNIKLVPRDGKIIAKISCGCKLKRGKNFEIYEFNPITVTDYKPILRL